MCLAVFTVTVLVVIESSLQIVYVYMLVCVLTYLSNNRTIFQLQF